MLECKCKICGNNFVRKKSQIMLGGGNICSNQCRYVARKNGKNILCDTCGAEAYKSLKNLNASKSGKHFCSKKCLLISNSKNNDGHPNWKGGEFSYRSILMRQPEIKVQCILCKEKDSRMLTVHHIDKNRSNNSIKNLTWLCHNCHFLVHTYTPEQKKLSQYLHVTKM